MFFLVSSFDNYMFVFFFNDTATTEIYTLSLHDALPIYRAGDEDPHRQGEANRYRGYGRRSPLVGGYRDHHEDKNEGDQDLDRKSTRLNSSHANISYAVFCLKKKKKIIANSRRRTNGA